MLLEISGSKLLLGYVSHTFSTSVYRILNTEDLCSAFDEHCFNKKVPPPKNTDLSHNFKMLPSSGIKTREKNSQLFDINYGSLWCHSRQPCGCIIFGSEFWLHCEKKFKNKKNYGEKWSKVPLWWSENEVNNALYSWLKTVIHAQSGTFVCKLNTVSACNNGVELRNAGRVFKRGLGWNLKGVAGPLHKESTRLTLVRRISNPASTSRLFLISQVRHSISTKNIELGRGGQLLSRDSSEWATGVRAFFF